MCCITKCSQDVTRYKLIGTTTLSKIFSFGCAQKTRAISITRVISVNWCKHHSSCLNIDVKMNLSIWLPTVQKLTLVTKKPNKSSSKDISNDNKAKHYWKWMHFKQAWTNFVFSLISWFYFLTLGEEFDGTFHIFRARSIVSGFGFVHVKAKYISKKSFWQSIDTKKFRVRGKYLGKYVYFEIQTLRWKFPPTSKTSLFDFKRWM